MYLEMHLEKHVQITTEIKVAVIAKNRFLFEGIAKRAKSRTFALEV